jgi:hypothetical protein
LERLVPDMSGYNFPKPHTRSGSHFGAVVNVKQVAVGVAKANIWRAVSGSTRMHGVIMQALNGLGMRWHGSMLDLH